MQSTIKTSKLLINGKAITSPLNKVLNWRF
ncbi:hypothetical protein [Escherichia phage vB_EcoM_ULIM3]|uniref:Uncharacterized protein n=1 Tax=Escherichia phage vB_EcoM_LMP25 TaxID=2491663 RepID=A0A482MRL4_9CAUD|nr:hypothetical protein [Escherichia phage vB_EcoM_LMP34]QBQ76232.1 hypothetical protein [Escherichia phage vB_EcoM_LMP33]QBQ76288.1 hypothetical protein [Escherichia phage vB_EcoM_LMP25]WPJ69770.1 hypothetical protein [Escherichia phage vB_EcoM_ULIM3]WPJ69930.1 hypothetical protein [Escherichia phage vB_EcoM_ULIM8]